MDSEDKKPEHEDHHEDQCCDHEHDEPSYDEILEQSRQVGGGAMGAVAFAVLEMFRRAGMDGDDIQDIAGKMEEFFPNPSNDDCNDILRMVETRLTEEKRPTGMWFGDETALT